ncbi:hypothetical protein BDW62DRAFT_185060 [Aspergillus aurantiobrunneus]
MKFSFAAAALFAAGAVASMQAGGDAQQYTTVEVTETSYYCPSSTAPAPVATTGVNSDGPYSVTRPLITTTVTRCKACSSSTPSVAASSTSVPVVPTTSIPVIPSGVAPTGSSSATGTPSSTTPAAPVFTGGANRAAAGAGAVAGLFGVVAALL